MIQHPNLGQPECLEKCLENNGLIGSYGLLNSRFLRLVLICTSCVWVKTGSFISSSIGELSNTEISFVRIYYRSQMLLFVDSLGTLFFSGSSYVLPCLLRLATLLQPLDQTLTTSLYTKFVIYFHS